MFASISFFIYFIQFSWLRWSKAYKQSIVEREICFIESRRTIGYTLNNSKKNTTRVRSKKKTNGKISRSIEVGKSVVKEQNSTKQISLERRAMPNTSHESKRIQAKLGWCLHVILFCSVFAIVFGGEETKSKNKVNVSEWKHSVIGLVYG